MDQDLREAFATLSSQIADCNANARTAADRATDAAIGVRRLEGRVEKLEKHVFGTEPPPAPPAVSIVRQVSEQDMETDALKAQVIILDTKVDKLTEMQERQNEMLSVITKAVGGILGNPTVRRIATLAGALLLAWLTAKTQGVLK